MATESINAEPKRALAGFEVEEALAKAKAILMLLSTAGDQMPEAVGYAASAAVDLVEAAQAELGLLDTEEQPA